QHAPPAALLLYHPEPRVFTEREIQLLTNFANHAAMAIENATLFAHSDTQLQEQTRRLEALIQSMQDGLILENLEGQVLYANRRIEELAGLPLDAIHGIPVAQLMDRLLAQAVDRTQVDTAVADALRQTGGQRRVQFALAAGDKPRYLQLTLFDVTDARATLIGRGRILKDITQRYEVDRMKSSLISTVSHELRTPLAAIKGYASTLLADDVEWDAASQREFLGIISAETDHLSALVSDLLDMSRIESGSLTVSRVPCELADLVQQAAQHAYPPPGSRLRIALPADMPPLEVDPKRITAVLRNLLENSVKYGGDGYIQLSAVVAAGQAVIRVADSGPGIPTTEQAHIFNSFYRVDNSLTRQTTGAGLGLAISRGFVRAHGGDIWIEPRPVGTCVAFSLPLALAWAVAETAEMVQRE
ncbi:MAG: PAS domain-containing protein, partial [Anaerolineales bacterium]|nr:PAS domain-containing protein [Anaerolineales bacterium]